MAQLCRPVKKANRLARSESSSVHRRGWFLAVVLLWMIFWYFFRQYRNPEKCCRGRTTDEPRGPGNPAEVNPGSVSAVRSAPQTAEETNAVSIGAVDRVSQATSEDDLTVVDGIGPKISLLLKSKGIRTFKQLAETSAEALREIMLEAGLRLADPRTWPDQARFASDNDRAGLKEYQKRVKGRLGSSTEA